MEEKAHQLKWSAGKAELADLILILFIGTLPNIDHRTRRHTLLLFPYCAAA